MTTSTLCVRHSTPRADDDFAKRGRNLVSDQCSLPSVFAPKYTCSKISASPIRLTDTHSIDMRECENVSRPNSSGRIGFASTSGPGFLGR